MPATRKATRATPRARAPRALPRPSDPQEATQRDPRPDRRDEDRGTEENRHQRREGEGAVVLRDDQRVVAAEGVDDRDLADPQDDYGDQPSQEADHDPLDQERPADEPTGGADQPHHLDLAAAGEDRKADRVADQHQRG